MVKMGSVCEAHDVKLLTYGTLVSLNVKLLAMDWLIRNGSAVGSSQTSG